MYIFTIINVYYKRNCCLSNWGSFGCCFFFQIYEKIKGNYMFLTHEQAFKKYLGGEKLNSWQSEYL